MASETDVLNFNNNVSDYLSQLQYFQNEAIYEANKKQAEDEGKSQLFFDSDLVGSELLNKLFRTQSFNRFNDYLVDQASNPESYVGQKWQAFKNWSSDNFDRFLSSVGNLGGEDGNTLLDLAKRANILPRNLTLQNFRKLATAEGRKELFSQAQTAVTDRVDAAVTGLQQQVNNARATIDDQFQGLQNIPESLQSQVETGIDQLRASGQQAQARIAEIQKQASNQLSDAGQAARSQANALVEQGQTISQNIANIRNEVEPEEFTSMSLQQPRTLSSSVSRTPSQYTSLLEQEGGFTSSFISKAKATWGSFVDSLQQVFTKSQTAQQLTSPEPVISQTTDDISQVVSRGIIPGAAVQPGEAIQVGAKIASNAGKTVVARGTELLASAVKSVGSVAAEAAPLVAVSIAEGEITNQKARQGVELVTNTVQGIDALPNQFGGGFISAGVKQLASGVKNTINKLTGQEDEATDQPAPEEIEMQVFKQNTPEDLATDATTTEPMASPEGQVVGEEAGQEIADAAATASESVGEEVTSTATEAAIAGSESVPIIGEIIGAAFGISMLASSIFEATKDDNDQPEMPTIGSLSIPAFQAGI